VRGLRQKTHHVPKIRAGEREGKIWGKGRQSASGWGRNWPKFGTHKLLWKKIVIEKKKIPSERKKGGVRNNRGKGGKTPPH